MKIEVSILRMGPDAVDSLVVRDYMNSEDMAQAVLAVLKNHDDILVDINEELYNKIIQVGTPSIMDIRAIKSEMKAEGYDLCYGIVEGESGIPENSADHVYINIETNELKHLFVPIEDADILKYYTEVYNMLGLNTSKFIAIGGQYTRALETLSAIESAVGHVTHSYMEYMDGLLNELGFVRYIMSK